jgi:glyoxylase-like metal-dependent hydrolase (beta-lactamase superfamily II)
MQKWEEVLMAARHELNAPGPWYVDTRCINCSAARTVAPGLIVEKGKQSVFARQPETPEELMMAWRARLLCPTESVRTSADEEMPAGIFPQEMTNGVYRLGYNARSSYGAHSFLVQRPPGNVVIDAPRWADSVVATIEARGGLSDILLTHRDDAADAERYAKHFGAHVSIHEADCAAAPYADRVLRGSDPIVLDDDLLAIPAPGHTKDSVVYLWDRRCLFTGDTLSWSFDQNDLLAFRELCFYSWEELTLSLERLLAHRFEWVFAGHGGSNHLPADEMRSRLAALVERMRQA